MSFKILTAAALLGLTSATVSATSINIRHEFVPEYDGQDAKHSDRIEISHRFSNGIGYGVEAKWKSQNDDAFGEQTGNGQQTNISYSYKLSDKLTLKPQYKWESGSDKVGHQFNLSLGYKVSDDWSVGFRHRYHYENKVGSDNSHYNRWTFSAGYKGIEDWAFGADLDYTFNEEKSGPRWKGEQFAVSDINFKGTYKGLNNGWSPFAELGFTPYKSGKTYSFKGEQVSSNDQWRPRYRIGVKYSY
ncbi:oligogalacturonate-specific porin KdgM family protein [Marinomonas profundimaris]|uniref:Porin n=1 Tax=Marinomonas profundimaris TaxID=1208321 RepID=W1RSX9_9GAMM|nr:oligogalacturonate-specific porin KdgM family protein [Marinomonas profundimaris]ETI59895.1 porin [Marinomonas profundimaris]